MRFADKLVLLILCLLVYGATNYGGARAPESEIVFRTAEALVTRGTLALAGDLEDLPGVGVAQGRDGRFYSIYPPLQAVVEAPLVRLAITANRSKWYTRHARLIQPSFYFQGGLNNAINGTRPDRLEPHARRFLVSFLNAFLTALGVLVFYLILLRLGLSRAAGLAGALLYAFGTLAWPYAGTMLSEPLATLLVLGSFLMLLPDVRAAATKPSAVRLVGSGLCLGLACSAHDSALLFAPFLLFYAFSAAGGARNPRASWKPAACFAAGCAASLALLAYCNSATFGSVFGPGSMASAGLYGQLGYGALTSPFTGLYGLLLGPDKGLFTFCPAALLGVAAFGGFARRQRTLAAVIGSALAFRVLFIAAHANWHGGLTLGPRPLVMAIPFCIIPAACRLQDMVDGRRRAALVFAAIAGLALVAQQFYFVLGDIFRFYALLLTAAAREGANPLQGDQLYLSGDFSPLTGLLRFGRSPFVLAHASASDAALWAAGVAIVAVISAMALAVVWRGSRHDDPAAAPRDAADPPVQQDNDGGRRKTKRR